MSNDQDKQGPLYVLTITYQATRDPPAQVTGPLDDPLLVDLMLGAARRVVDARYLATQFNVQRSQIELVKVLPGVTQ